MSIDTRLADLVSLWQRRRAAGEDVTPVELCRGYPELLPEVERQLRAVRDLERLAGAETADLSRAAESTPSPGVATPAGLPDLPGYEVLSVLGRGGMGIVYKGRHLALNRLVALKTILPNGCSDQDDVRRFLGEAEAVATLKHPNVVQVYEVGRHDGLPYMALELVDGGSLADRLLSGPLPPHEAARVVEQVAHGMNAAHQAGIVHRDLKPGNVLLTRAGQAKVTDFGLAKKVEGGSDLTRSGAILGTPSYMAPEQAGGHGKRVGPAADVYALGATLYACVTGKPPFQASTPLDTVLRVVGEEPTPPRQLNPSVPRDLETVCLKCLQKDPLQRYASAEALADDLRRWLADEPIAARPVSNPERLRRWCRKNPLAAALVCAVLLALVGGLSGVSWAYGVALENERQALNSEKQARASELKAVSSEKQARHQQSLAEQAAGLAKTEQDRATRETKRAELALESLRRETEAKDEAGRKLLESNKQLTVAKAGLEAALERLRDEQQSTQQQFRTALYARDLQQAAAFCRRGELTQAWSVLVEVPLDLRAWEWNYLARACAPTSADSGMGVWPSTKTLTPPPAVPQKVGAPEPLTLRGHTDTVLSLAFSPDGRLLASAGSDVAIRLWDVRTGQLVRTLSGHTGDVRCIAFSPHGMHLLSGGTDGSLRRWDVTTGSPLRQRVDQGTQYFAATYSPDGKRIIVGGGIPGDASGTPGKGVAYLLDAATLEPTATLSGHTDLVRTVAFNRDGSQLVTGSYDRTLQIWQADTAISVRTLRGHALAVLGAAFSPDGRHLISCSGGLGVAGRADIGGLKLWETESGQEVMSQKAHVRSCFGVLYSHDGKRLLTCSEDHTWKVWDAATRQELLALPGHTGPVRCLAATRDGVLVATGGEDRTVKIWSAAATMRSFEFRMGQPSSVAPLRKIYRPAATPSGPK